MEVENILIGAVVLPVLAWLCLTTIQHGKRLVVMGKTQDDMNGKLSDLTKSFEGMQNKMDLFLKSELDTLKELSRSTSEAMRNLSNHSSSRQSKFKS